MEIGAAVELIGVVVDIAGVAVIVAAVVAAGAAFATRTARRTHAFDASYRQLRRDIGRGILLGLELLVAGDIIRTVAIEPTFRSVGVLAFLVLVRTFLSFALEIELTGRWPWARGELESAPD